MYTLEYSSPVFTLWLTIYLFIALTHCLVPSKNVHSGNIASCYWLCPALTGGRGEAGRDVWRPDGAVHDSLVPLKRAHGLRTLWIPLWKRTMSCSIQFTAYSAFDLNARRAKFPKTLPSGCEWFCSPLWATLLFLTYEHKAVAGDNVN